MSDNKKDYVERIEDTKHLLPYAATFGNQYPNSECSEYVPVVPPVPFVSGSNLAYVMYYQMGLDEDIHGTRFYPATSGQTHIVAVGYDNQFNPSWKTQIVASSSSEPLQPIISLAHPILLDDGTSINSFSMYSGYPNTIGVGAGAIQDSLVSIRPSNTSSAPVDVTCKNPSYYNVRWQHYYLVCLDSSGSVNWASPVFNQNQKHLSTSQYGSWWSTSGLHKEVGNNDSFRILTNFHTNDLSAWPAVATTTTFMPGTDGTLSASHYQGETWEFLVKYTDGTITGSIYSSGAGAQTGNTNYSSHNAHGSLVVKTEESGIVVKSYTQRNIAGSSYEYHSAQSNPGYNTTENAPVPGFPHNTRWQRSTIGTYARHNIIARNSDDTIRYAVVAGINEADYPAATGITPIPGTDDVLFASSRFLTGNGTVVVNHTSPETASYSPSVSTGSAIVGSYSGWMLKIKDNKSNPAQPHFDSVVSFFVDTANGATSSTVGYYAPCILSSSQEMFVARSLFVNGTPTMGFSGGSGNFTSTRYSMNRLAPSAPTVYGCAIPCWRVSDMYPQWVITLESTNYAFTKGYITRKGREAWMAYSFKDNMSVQHWSSSSYNNGTNLPNTPELVLSSSGESVGILRFDISTGKYKGYTQHVSQTTSSLSTAAFQVMNTYTNFEYDMSDLTGSVGVPITSDTPVVTNPSGSYNFYNVGTSLAGSGMSMDAETGIISGTPTITGSWEIVQKVIDVNGYFSYSNSWMITIS